MTEPEHRPVAKREKVRYVPEQIDSRELRQLSDDILMKPDFDSLSSEARQAWRDEERRAKMAVEERIHSASGRIVFTAPRGPISSIMTDYGVVTSGEDLDARLEAIIAGSSTEVWRTRVAAALIVLSGITAGILLLLGVHLAVGVGVFAAGGLACLVLSGTKMTFEGARPAITGVGYKPITLEVAREFAEIRRRAFEQAVRERRARDQAKADGVEERRHDSFLVGSIAPPAGDVPAVDRELVTELLRRAVQTRDETRAAFAEWDSDLAAVLFERPLLADATDPFTEAFNEAFDRMLDEVPESVADLAGTVDESRARDILAVAQAGWDAWVAASRHAADVGLGTMTDKERDAIALAKKYLAIAANPGASDQERHTSIGRVIDTLAGVTHRARGAVETQVLATVDARLLAVGSRPLTPAIERARDRGSDRGDAAEYEAQQREESGA